jgi:hypothetical protein
MSATAAGTAIVPPAISGELSTDLRTPGPAFRLVAMLGTTAVQEESDMHQIESARARVEHATGLPAVLDAAYDAFEQMLTAITIRQDRGGETFAAFVMSGTAAATGRDALAAAPSLPRVSSGDLAGTTREPCGDLPPQAAAEALASLSQLLSRRLTDASERSADVGDRVACIQAARHAAYICSLLGGTPEP